jgi:hydroxymethylbilane synthase
MAAGAHLVIDSIADRPTTAEFAAERAASEVLGGDCHSAISIFAEARGETIAVSCRVFSKDNSRSISHSAQGPLANAIGIGKQVANEILERGGAAILC